MGDAERLTRGRRWRQRVGALGLALAATLLTTEAALRLFGHASMPIRQLLYLPGQVPAFDGITTLDQLMAVAPLPLPPFRIWGGFKLNSHGLYTGEYARAKASGTFRILALGDSFTFDSGMVPPASIWHAQVGDGLAKQLGRPVEVINLGLPAVGPRFAAKMYDVEGRLLAPDLVVFGLFLGNDLTDESGARGSALLRYSLSWRAARHLWALRQSQRQIESTQSYWRTPGADVGAPRGGYAIEGFTYDPEFTFFSADEFRRIEMETARVYLKSQRAQVTTWVHEVADVVAGLQAQVTATPARFVVGLFPDQLQINPAGVDPEDFDADGLVTLVRDALTARDVQTIDVAPALRRAPTSPRLYRRQDVHWSIAGNTIVAAAMLAALTDVH